jgi:purine-binding chemotaxis protein CheW
VGKFIFRNGVNAMNLDTVAATSTININVKSSTGEHLAFVPGGESYGIEILKVQEIRCYDVVTQSANTANVILSWVCI